MPNCLSRTLDAGIGMRDQAQQVQKQKPSNGRLAMNKCNQCGSSSYKPVIKRDDHGDMRQSGQYQCTGCKLVFAKLDEWRFGEVLHDSPEKMLLDQAENNDSLT